MRITANRLIDNQQAFYCELWLNGTQLKTAQYFEASEEAKYEVIEAPSKEAFKIVDASTRETLILVNRKTGESWPWRSDTETFEDARLKKAQLDSIFASAGQE